MLAAFYLIAGRGNIVYKNAREDLGKLARMPQNVVSVTSARLAEFGWLKKTGNDLIRKLPDEVHRAIRIQAAQHGRSSETEIRAILERAVKPKGRVKLGSFLVAIGREAGGLTDEAHTLFESERV